MSSPSQVHVTSLDDEQENLNRTGPERVGKTKRSTTIKKGLRNKHGRRTRGSFVGTNVWSRITEKWPLKDLSTVVNSGKKRHRTHDRTKGYDTRKGTGIKIGLKIQNGPRGWSDPRDLNSDLECSPLITLYTETTCNPPESDDLHTLFDVVTLRHRPGVEEALRVSLPKGVAPAGHDDRRGEGLSDKVINTIHTSKDVKKVQS